MYPFPGCLTHLFCSSNQLLTRADSGTTWALLLRKNDTLNGWHRMINDDHHHGNRINPRHGTPGVDTGDREWRIRYETDGGDPRSGDRPVCTPRESDVVTAIHDITSTLTGNTVSSGTTGVVVKQTATVPATYRVRFTATETPGRAVVLDDLTDHDISPIRTN